MERLTEKLKQYIDAYQKPPFGREVEGTVELLQEVTGKLKEYEDLEEQGLLLKLPCKVGSKAYGIFMDCPKDFKPEYCTDHEGSCEKCHHRVPVIISIKFSLYNIPDFGKTVFLTQAEAEETLEKMN